MFVLPDFIQFNPNLSITLRDFLRALAHHCGDKPTCWPSQARIAGFMGRSVRTVQRCEREAVELRLIEVRRRWLKSNVYTVLCLEERPVIHNDDTMAAGRTDRPGTKQRLTGRVVSSWKSPKEIKILIEDMGEVFGPDVTARNHGWLWHIAQSVKDSWLYETLSWVKECMEVGEASGDRVVSPCALFTWRLRAMGAPV